MESNLSHTCRRISVVGTTGSGKTTLARAISRRLGIPHVELDALHWEPNWVEAPDTLFRERTERALSGDSWVVDGNYSQTRDIVWGTADTVIFLDYPLPMMLWRLTRRTLRRILRGEELWNGNKESIRSAFFSRDSIFLWLLTTYRRRRREYTELFSRPEYAHMALFHFRTPRQTEQWLRVLPRHRTEK